MILKYCSTLLHSSICTVLRLHILSLPFSRPIYLIINIIEKLVIGMVVLAVVLPPTKVQWIFNVLITIKSGCYAHALIKTQKNVVHKSACVLNKWIYY